MNSNTPYSESSYIPMICKCNFTFLAQPRNYSDSDPGNRDSPGITAHKKLYPDPKDYPEVRNF